MRSLHDASEEGLVTRLDWYGSIAALPWPPDEVSQVGRGGIRSAMRPPG